MAVLRLSLLFILKLTLSIESIFQVKKKGYIIYQVKKRTLMSASLIVNHLFDWILTFAQAFSSACSLKRTYIYWDEVGVDFSPDPVWKYHLHKDRVAELSPTPSSWTSGVCKASTGTLYLRRDTLRCKGVMIQHSILQTNWDQASVGCFLGRFYVFNLQGNELWQHHYLQCQWMEQLW